MSNMAHVPRGRSRSIDGLPTRVIDRRPLGAGTHLGILGIWTARGARISYNLRDAGSSGGCSRDAGFPEKKIPALESSAGTLATVLTRFAGPSAHALGWVISHRFPLSRAVEALHLAANPQPDSMKVVIQPGA